MAEPHRQVDAPTLDLAAVRRATTRPNERRRRRRPPTVEPARWYTIATATVAITAAADWVALTFHRAALADDAELRPYLDEHIAANTAATGSAALLLAIWAIWAIRAGTRHPRAVAVSAGRPEVRSNQPVSRFEGRAAPGQRTWVTRDRQTNTGRPPPATADVTELDDAIQAGVAHLGTERRPSRRFTVAAAVASLAATAGWGAFALHSLFVAGGPPTSGIVIHAVLASILTMVGIALDAVWLVAWRSGRRESVRDQLAADRYERLLAEIGQMRADLRDGDGRALAAVERAQQLIGSPEGGTVRPFPARPPNMR
ncbi:hypothetical protein [Verrucosispora sp. WMMC514]|uniref:hypothetical protein n=1 Tax=Verrucosispora sp. WMMC514 TaxID=3015156 RepID=UPI00248B0C64|nr:hypothetical protein [Verrucosispora sp. WMMC514]WBB94094.1 hypothetical protein O7597_14530 [Verrucosispora sp. WMMC514]